MDKIHKTVFDRNPLVKGYIPFYFLKKKGKMIFSLLWTKSVSLRGTPVTDAVINTMMYDDHSNHRHENPEFLTAFGWLYPQKPLPPDQTWVKAATKCTAPSSSSSSSSLSSPSSSSPSFYQLRHQCCVV